MLFLDTTCRMFVFVHCVLSSGIIIKETMNELMNECPVAHRPSVPPSRWCIVSRRVKISPNFFLNPLAPSFERRYQIPRGTPSAVAKNTRRWENFAIFDLNHRLSKKRYEIGPS